MNLLPNLSRDDAFLALPDKCRVELIALKPHLDFIMASASMQSACRMVAEQLMTIGVVVGATALYRRIRLFRRTRDWRDLLDRRVAGGEFWDRPELAGVPPAFTEFARGVFERHQRNDKAGWRELVQIWRTHQDTDGHPYEKLPGYDGWPAKDPRTGYPKGWTYKNLIRLAKPDPYDSAAARVGLFAASAHRPPLLTTRVGLLVGERVEFDDHEYNVKILLPGQSKEMRPRGLTAADVLSGKLVPSFKPTLWDLEEEKKRGLTERDSKWFVVFWLTRVGYRRDRGTTLVVEHGLMAIREEFERRIHLVTDGMVKVERGGMFGAAAHPGQFRARGKGNFKSKPLVEGAHSIVDNALDRLPGQTGLDRHTAPEELHGREEYMRRLLRAAQTALTRGADPKALESLRPPFLTYSQFLTRALDAFEAINTDCEHSLEGWGELGFETIEWRPTESMPWLPEEQLKALPPAEQQVMNALMSNNASLMRSRRLSREEVWQRGVSELERVGPKHWSTLMGLEHGRELTVTRQGLFEIDDRDLSPGPLRFLAAANGRHFPPGDKFLVFVNPFEPRFCQVTRAQGEHLAICAAWDLPSKNDVEGIKRQLGRQGEWLRERRDKMQSRHMLEAQGRADMVAHNDAVVKTARDGRDQAKAARLRKFDGKIEDLIDEPSQQRAAPAPATDDDAAIRDLEALI